MRRSSPTLTPTAACWTRSRPRSKAPEPTPAARKTDCRTSRSSTQPFAVGTAAAANESAKRSLDDREHLAGRHLVACRHAQFYHTAIARHLQLILHLHRLNDDDALVRLHRLARIHKHTRNAPRHGGL